MSKFMCGKCCFKNKLNKSDRFVMASKVVEGSNQCEDCGFEVLFENGRWVKASMFVVKQGKKRKQTQ